MTEASRPALSAAARRRAARDREFRRIRIAAMVQAGRIYGAIERARQLVAQALEASETEIRLVHARAPVARPEPARRRAPGAEDSTIAEAALDAPQAVEA
jgi:hypothetical protein